MRLNFNFSSKLMFNLSLLQRRLEQHLQGHNVLAGLLPANVQVAELPFPHRPSIIEILQGPLMEKFGPYMSELLQADSL